MTERVTREDVERLRKLVANRRDLAGRRVSDLLLLLLYERDASVSEAEAWAAKCHAIERLLPGKLAEARKAFAREALEKWDEIRVECNVGRSFGVPSAREMLIDWLRAQAEGGEGE